MNESNLQEKEQPQIEIPRSEDESSHLMDTLAQTEGAHSPSAGGCSAPGLSAASCKALLHLTPAVPFQPGQKDIILLPLAISSCKR